MAELVGDEVLRGVGAPEQDRPDQRVAVVAAQARQAEEPRRDDDSHPVDPHRPRIERERVEPLPGAPEPCVGRRAQEPAAGGVRTRTGLPSEAAWNWNAYVRGWVSRRMLPSSM